MPLLTASWFFLFLSVMDFDKLYSSGLHCPEPADIADVAKRLSVTLPENFTLLLDGSMGAGKTFFASALAHALGVKEQVSSPTYDIVNIYASSSVNLVHVDAYRLESSKDAENLGIEELLIPPWILLVEWPQKVPELVFGEAWRLTIQSPPCGGRSLRLVKLLDA
ncbi:MAG: tRNA (adenosine(37)-N6)-threonylcarbamoyltransferase complex ATPase subunit type 1 TsaE [Opitutae bacterium]|nr:tRNA (adenosine(37)-N6)-threonylcarbamoyltransferase complex ATPase subunit type 1 TsaE [Opitutae bacterium]